MNQALMNIIGKEAEYSGRGLLNETTWDKCKINCQRHKGTFGRNSILQEYCKNCGLQNGLNDSTVSVNPFIHVALSGGQ